MRAAALTCAGVAIGCGGGDPEPLRWEISASPPELIDRVSFVTASIRAGGCGGDAVYVAEVARTGAMPPDPPVLEDGTWAFSARAGDTTCRLVAEGCRVVELPTEGPVRIEITAVTAPIQLCDESMCIGGRCGSGRDAGARDGGGVDGGTDAGPPGTPCGSDFCNDCEACEMEMCVARSDGFVCDDGGGRCVAGECCTACVDLMGACRAGDEAEACGLGGAGCIACGACLACAAGECVPAGDVDAGMEDGGADDGGADDGGVLDGSMADGGTCP